MTVWSETTTFLDGQWLEGNAPIVGPRTHAFRRTSCRLD
jgi:branched-chain amino acid aminotransferase